MRVERVVVSGLLPAVLIAVSACRGSTDGDPVMPVQAATFVNVQPGLVTLNTGQSHDFFAQANGDPAQAIAWTIAPQTVATMSSQGDVAKATCVGPGLATLFARKDSVGGSARIECVQAPEVRISPDPVPTTTVGESVQLSATVLGLATQTVVWDTSAPSRVTVSSGGLARCVAAGSATVSAASTVDVSIRDEVTVTCQAAVASGSVTVSPTSLTFVHPIGASSCPQSAGTFFVNNDTDDTVTVSLGVPSMLSVSPPGSFTIAPRSRQSVFVSFNCSTQTSFTAAISVTVTRAGATTNAGSVTVSGTITS